MELKLLAHILVGTCAVAFFIGGVRCLVWKYRITKYVNDNDPAVRKYWRRFLRFED